jgi:signal transduction histidine kinase
MAPLVNKPVREYVTAKGVVTMLGPKLMPQQHNKLNGAERAKTLAGSPQSFFEISPSVLEPKSLPDGPISLADWDLSPDPMWLMDAEGGVHWWNQAAHRVYGGQIAGSNSTERTKTEQLLRNANRTLQAIRDCHEVLLRAATERELLEEICRIIVQSGERMAWVGFAEKNSRKTVRPVAAAGVDPDHLKNLRVTWSNTLHGRGPVGTAIRTGKPSLCQNTLTDPKFAPWREAARRLGYGSVIALPLMSDKGCFGALAIYAPEPDAFEIDEQLMLTDLANDLAFGISALRLRAEREQLEDEIIKSIEREQERIGRDLHDGLCQLLVGAKYRSVFLQKLSGNKSPESTREAKALEEILNHAIQQARDLAP